MTTECNSTYLDFPMLGSRQVLADFHGGDITSDGGALLLRKTEQLTAIRHQFAAGFTDHRNPDLIEHSLEERVAPRIYGLALGDEDLNDHDDRRRDPLLATVVGQQDPTGQTRQRSRDRGKARAGKSTLNRLELTPVGAKQDSRSTKITCNTRAVEQLLGDLVLQTHRTPPTHSVRDLDATDDPIHGHQFGRFFHGSYQSSCSLPFSIFWGDHRRCARLRPSDIDASAGALKQRKRIVAQIRPTGPAVTITIRADSGFCREPILAWCEPNVGDSILGLAQNPRLVAAIADELGPARHQFEATGQPARIFAAVGSRTLETWSRARRVVATAEHLAQGAHPRFGVPSLSPEQRPARPLDEDDSWARGEAENRIQEQQLHLFADRTRAHPMRARQIRLFFSSIA